MPLISGMLQAQDGTDRLGQALQKVLQEDTGALIHRLHKEEMCMNCDWSRIDLEQSGQVRSSRAFQAALGAWSYLGHEAGSVQGSS